MLACTGIVVAAVTLLWEHTVTCPVLEPAGCAIRLMAPSPPPATSITWLCISPVASRRRSPSWYPRQSSLVSVFRIVCVPSQRSYSAISA